MPSNDLFGDGDKAPVWTIGTPDPGLLADAPHPFVFASRRITGLSGSLALEPDGKNVRSPAKQRPEQLDLRLWRRILGDQLAVFIRCRGLLARSTLRSGNLQGHIVMLGTKPQGVHFAVARKCGKKRCAKIFAVVKVSGLDIPLFFSRARITSNPIPPAISHSQSAATGR